MRAILIDPFDKKVTMVEVENLPQIHKLLHVEQVAVAPLTERSHTVMGQGNIEAPGMRFWRFLDSPPLHGRALIRGNTADGLIAEDCPLDLALVTQNVLFLDVEFDGWQTVPKFRPLAAQPAPAALPQPVEPPKPQGKPWSIWTITENDDGYVATLVTVDGSGNAKQTGNRLENEDLDELRAMLPPGFVKVDRSTTDDPSIVESWHTPLQS